MAGLIIEVIPLNCNDFQVEETKTEPVHIPPKLERCKESEIGYFLDAS